MEEHTHCNDCGNAILLGSDGFLCAKCSRDRDFASMTMEDREFVTRQEAFAIVAKEVADEATT